MIPRPPVCTVKWVKITGCGPVEMFQENCPPFLQMTATNKPFTGSRNRTLPGWRDTLDCFRIIGFRKIGFRKIGFRTIGFGKITLRR